MGNLEIFIHVACAIIVIIISARILGNVMQFIKQPRVVGEMIAGVALGPTLFGTIFPEGSTYLFSTTQPYIYVLGNIGLSFYMFLVGMDLDLTNIDTKTKRKSYILSIIATVVPFSFGCLSAYLFYDQFQIQGVPIVLFMLFLGTAFSIMAFPMLARILEEEKLIHTPLGSICLLSASIQDVMTWILLAFITAIASTGNCFNGFVTLFGACIFILLVRFIIKPILEKINVSLLISGKLSQNQFAIILVLLLIAAVITDKIGLYSVFGGFILGLNIPKSKILISQIKEKLQDVMVVLLLPLFFAFSGLKTNFLVLGSSNLLMPCLVILCFAFISKYGSVLITMKSFGYSWRESSAIGGLINARGLMVLIVANIGLDYKIINSNLYSILVLLAVLSTLTAMPIYKMSLNKLKIVK
jgi:Kef-type K+ transport system membrane component KefB